MLGEAEIGSERDRGSTALLDASFSRECGNQICQSCDSLYMGVRRRGHRSGPCAGGSGRRRRNLVELESPVSMVGMHGMRLANWRAVGGSCDIMQFAKAREYIKWI